MLLQSLRFRCHFPQIVLLALLLVTLASGCGVFKKESDSNNVAPVGTRLNGVLKLSETDNNRTAELRVGDSFIISLPENRSAGYSWAIDESNSRLLALDSTQYTEPTEGFISARGQRVFNFHCRQAGEVALKLKYWRFTEGDASITERYSLTVRITP